MLKRRTMIGGSVAAMLAMGRHTLAESPGSSETSQSDDRSVTYLAAGKPFATYVHQDEQITRPYFKDLRSIAGDVPLSRHFPPRKGIDLDDHALFHPGLWLAFGDISGEDFWRLKARVIHAEFAAKTESQTRGTTSNAYREDVSTVINRFETAAGKPLLRERCRFGMSRLKSGWLLTWDSTFEPIDGDLAFGDQEEMGLGIRLATPLIVKNGGAIVNSHGDRNEKGCWGKPAQWCDYSGVVEQRRYGLLLLPHPKNFATCAFHARDYGLLVANPFARQAFGMSKVPAKTVVKRGESLRLRFGVYGYGLPDEKPVAGAELLTEYVTRAEA